MFKRYPHTAVLQSSVTTIDANGNPTQVTTSQTIECDVQDKALSVKNATGGFDYISAYVVFFSNSIDTEGITGIEIEGQLKNIIRILPSNQLQNELICQA